MSRAQLDSLARRLQRQLILPAGLPSRMGCGHFHQALASEFVASQDARFLPQLWQKDIPGATSRRAVSVNVVNIIDSIRSLLLIMIKLRAMQRMACMCLFKTLLYFSIDTEDVCMIMSGKSQPGAKYGMVLGKGSL